MPKRKVKKKSTKKITKLKDTEKKKAGRSKKIATEDVKAKPKKKAGRPKKNESSTGYLTKEDMEARAEKIKKDLPKYDPHKPRIVVDLSKNPEECKKATEFACFRPDVYLDYGCEFCSLYKHCACPIKDGMNKKSRRAFK